MGKERDRVFLRRIGPRKVRTRIGIWPVLAFIAISVIAALIGRWMEHHYEEAVNAKTPLAIHAR
jgi:hypothetical protein